MSDEGRKTVGRLAPPPACSSTLPALRSACVELPDGTVLAELHWCEAHGIGRKDMKVERLLE